MRLKLSEKNNKVKLTTSTTFLTNYYKILGTSINNLTKKETNSYKDNLKNNKTRKFKLHWVTNFKMRNNKTILSIT